MSVNLPPMPSIPPIPPISGNNKKDAAANKLYDQQLMQYQEAMARYNRVLQAMQQMHAEKTTKDTNMQKTSHDAMMAIANNMKA